MYQRKETDVNSDVTHARALVSDTRTLLCVKPGCERVKGFSGDAQSFCGLTSKIPPLSSMINFDADVKKRLRVTSVKTASAGSA